MKGRQPKKHIESWIKKELAAASGYEITWCHREIADGSLEREEHTIFQEMKTDEIRQMLTEYQSQADVDRLLTQ